ncbi:hypothetical protein TcCL_Unassigned02960 [Trypanosoma cruzi]|nr:hypothetical protein TcCL_Unassigned02960 [Trypanosoma cruzi]
MTGMTFSVTSTAKETSIPPCTRTHQDEPESGRGVAPQYKIPLKSVPFGLELCQCSEAVLLLRTVMSPTCKPTVRQSCNSLLPLGVSLDPSSIAWNGHYTPRTKLHEIKVRHNTTSAVTRATSALSHIFIVEQEKDANARSKYKKINDAARAEGNKNCAVQQRGAVLSSSTSIVHRSVPRGAPHRRA